MQDFTEIAATLKSPSSRRAWIEIGQSGKNKPMNKSPSSRRAWIEILYDTQLNGEVQRRPPRGGRG